MEPLDPFTRRAFLRRLGLGAGAIGLGGGLWTLGRALAGTEPAFERRGAIITLWLDGGPSQLETFDPHPGKAIAHGTSSIATAAPGIELAAGFEALAEQMQDVSLVRSLVSKEGDHERATTYLKSGYRPNPALIHPSLGALVCSELPVEGVEIPRHVSILPSAWPARGGFLGPGLDAFLTGDPASPLPDLRSPVGPERTEARHEDLAFVEAQFAAGREAEVAATRHREAVAKARTMMGSAQLAAFDIDEEPKAVRERYGDTPFGRGCLAARRLVEAGVRSVEVTLGGWDTHANNHELVAELVQTLDPAFAALIADLRERDLLASTVVLCGGEFGRTPRLNRLEGRDHWPQAFSWAIAGGGLRGGQVIGSSDPEGGRQVVDPRAIEDLHATALVALGIDPETELVTPDGRPVKLSEGTPITELS